ncbi:MAG TPA: energy transducer TonB [Candidatus Binatia bacterium]
MRKNFLLAPSLMASTLIHLAALMLATAIFGHRSYVSDRQLIAISLVDLPQEEKASRPREEDKRIEEKFDQALLKKQSVKEMPAQIKREAVNAQPSASPPLTAKNEPGQLSETKVSQSNGTARVEEGGGEDGVGNPFNKGDVNIATGTGTTGGGGGTAGLGRGSGTPGLPPQQPMLRTTREAKPIQTARATYPPMALRTGLESDVTLRIEIDTEGRVIKAEITKTGGAGFDEEALKAVKQSRFEPAQRDGQAVTAEFTYVYRFRLQR